MKNVVIKFIDVRAEKKNELKIGKMIFVEVVNFRDVK